VGSTAVVAYADGISIIVILSTLVQYIPQIYTTYKNRSGGSISVITLAIQAPGNLAIVLYQLLAHSTIATWLPFLSAFVQQTILIIEICVFHYCKQRCPSPYTAEDISDDDSETKSSDNPETQQKLINDSWGEK
jgi:uncharacterized protein with PQ loop repeat